MNFDLSDEQVMLKAQAARLFAERASPELLRQHLGSGKALDRPLWGALAELGVLGAALAESDGGVGMEPLDVAMIFEEAGRVCAPVPLFSSIGLAAEAIALCPDGADRSTWLPRLASGESIGCFAHVERSGPTLTAPIAATFREDTLDGEKFPVADADAADVIVAVARHGGGTAIVLARRDQPGVATRLRPGVDELRPHYAVSFTGAQATLLAEGDAAEQVIAALYDRAAVYAAFEAVGGAEAAMLMARDYALERRVFSRPIGSFQAIKHRLADALALIELARSNAWFAAWALAHQPSEAPLAAAAARVSAIRAYEFAARENLQTHGGIGYTWEANCHFHYRRARLLASHLGTIGEWSDRLVELMDAEPGTNRSAVEHVRAEAA